MANSSGRFSSRLVRLCLMSPLSRCLGRWLGSFSRVASSLSQLQPWRHRHLSRRRLLQLHRSSQLPRWTPMVIRSKDGSRCRQLHRLRGSGSSSGDHFLLGIDVIWLLLPERAQSKGLRSNPTTALKAKRGGAPGENIHLSSGAPRVDKRCIQPDTISEPLTFHENYCS